MIRNYLITAWRSISKNKLFSIINGIGLAIGLAVSIMIILYLRHEHSYDQFHEKSEQIAKLECLLPWQGDSIPQALMSFATGEIVQNYFPDVQAYSRIRAQYPYALLKSDVPGSTNFKEKTFLFADKNFLDIFSFRLLSGSKSSALKSPFTVLITKEISRKYFGESDAVGRHLIFNGKHSFTIVGIIADAPSNSSIQFGLVASMASLGAMQETKHETEGNLLQGGSFSTYIVLDRAANRKSLENRLTRLQTKLSKVPTPARFILTPLTDTHLSQKEANQATLKYLSYFPFIAGLILTLSIFNYICLCTSKAHLRFKEIGVRKVMGAGKKSIAYQFFLESALFTTASFILALLLCLAFQQTFFDFLGLKVDQEFIKSPQMLLSFCGLLILSVVLTAAYPSFILSAYKPVKAFSKVISKSTSGINFKRFVIVFQLTISTGLIICGVVVNSQLHFIRNTYTGLNRQNVIMLDFPESMGNRLSSIKSEIAGLAGIKEIAINRYPLYVGTDIWGVQSLDSHKEVALHVCNVDSKFISLLELEWAIKPPDSLYFNNSQQFILNERAVAELGLQKGVLHQKFQMGDATFEVAGVLKDFNFESLEKNIAPMGLSTTGDSSSRWSEWGGTMLIKTRPFQDLPRLIAKLKAVYERFEVTIPFSYSFLDENFNRLYLAEALLSKILIAFIAITLFLASLGLFGLVTFSISTRTNEIGIRKVLGASVFQIVNLLTNEFVKFVFIAWVVASPLACLTISSWLNSFAYKVELRWWMVISGGLAALLIAVCTVGLQSLKAARSNPVRTLRSD